jgi:hypothetical protein
MRRLRIVTTRGEYRAKILSARLEPGTPAHAATLDRLWFSRQRGTTVRLLRPALGDCLGADAAEAEDELEHRLRLWIRSTAQPES